MGRQINFYMDKETETTFLEEVVKKGQMLYVTMGEWYELLATDCPSKVPELNVKGQPPAYPTLFLHQPDLGEVLIRRYSNGTLGVDVLKSPIIEFARTVVVHEDKGVGCGRLYVQMTYWDENEELIQKPEELGKWQASLARWVR